jgi:hypothetical protein
MKFKPGDIVEANCVYRVVKTAIHRIKLDENIQLEIIRGKKTATFEASYVVRNLKTGDIELTQYWQDELTLVS